MGEQACGVDRGLVQVCDGLETRPPGERRNSRGPGAGALDQVQQPASHLYGSIGIGRGGEDGELAGRDTPDGVGRAAALLQEPCRVRQHRQRFRRGLCFQLDGDRHAGERGVAADRVRDQLARAALEPPQRVQSAGRFDRMVAAGALDEVLRADAAGASRTARAALGFGELLRGDTEAMKRRTRNYAKRQLTWMRKLAGVRVVDVSGRTPLDVAGELAREL